MADWINESVAIYSSRPVAENFFRLFVFIILILGSVVAAIRLVNGLSKEGRYLKGEKIKLDNAIWFIIISVCILLALVVAVLGITVEVITLKQVL